MSLHSNKPADNNAITSKNPGKEEVIASSVIDAALNYAQAHGFHVLPCIPEGKTPAISGGCHSATNDPEKITKLFKSNHNLGIRTGSQGGVIALDIDMPGGDESLASLIGEHGELPETVSATTPSGGRHYFFQCPDDFVIKRLIGKIGNKIDIIAEGSYVVASPSSLPEGDYAWSPGYAPWEAAIAKAPEWLLTLIKECQPRVSDPLSLSEDDFGGEEIVDGERNNTLASIAGSLRERNLGKEAILSALLIHNKEKCLPPLPDSEVEQIVNSIARYRRGKSRALVTPTRPYKDFPVDALPSPLDKFVASGAEAIGCDASYIVLPLLAGLASAIGNSYKIELKRGWSEPSILWAAIVGDSGTMKSPALNLALDPVREQQKSAATSAEIEQIEYKEGLQKYEAMLSKWKNGKMTQDPPERPEEPFVLRTYVDDLTTEALASILAQQPNGILVTCDELAGWFGSFDKYSGSSGGDAARWLSMYGAGPLSVDRKGDPKHIHIPSASVCVTGGIQPAILRRSLSKKYRENGLAARMLLACPPRKPKVWTEKEIDDACMAKVHKVYHGLYQLGFEEDGTFLTQALPLSPEAKKVWIEFHDRHGVEQAKLSGDLAAAYSKLEGGAARLTLILHLADCAAREDKTPGAISLDSMQRGIRLIEWFKYETRRVYAILDGEEIQAEQNRYVEKIREKGGNVTPSQFSRMFASHWETKEGAEKTLEDLKQRGFGHWEADSPGAEGGRPTRRFVLDE